jgi:hypothetical protein
MSPQNIREGDRLVVSLRRTLDRSGMLFSSEGTELNGQDLFHPAYYGLTTYLLQQNQEE